MAIVSEVVWIHPLEKTVVGIWPVHAVCLSRALQMVKGSWAAVHWIVSCLLSVTWTPVRDRNLHFLMLAVSGRLRGAIMINSCLTDSRELIGIWNQLMALERGSQWVPAPFRQTMQTKNPKQFIEFRYLVSRFERFKDFGGRLTHNGYSSGKECRRTVRDQRNTRDKYLLKLLAFVNVTVHRQYVHGFDTFGFGLKGKLNWPHSCVNQYFYINNDRNV